MGRAVIFFFSHSQLLSNNKMSSNKNIIISAAVKGFHVYRASWKPIGDKLFECSHEKENPYDSFSFKVFKPDSSAEIAGHLPV